MDDYTVTAAEAAHEVGVTRATIDTWAHRGYLQAIDPTARPRLYRLSEVFATEAARRIHPAHRVQLSRSATPLDTMLKDSTL